MLGVSYTISAIIAAAGTDAYKPLWAPVVGPFVGIATTGAFDSKNQAMDFGIFLIFDGLAQAGGLVTVILGAVGNSYAGDFARSPLVPTVGVGPGTTQLKWQF